MTSINPINMSYLSDAIHQDRLREMERLNSERLARAGQPASATVFAPVLASLGRGLMMLGLRLEPKYQAEHEHTPTRA